MDNIKIIVSHPGKQHSFQTATAMERTGILQYYVTSVYNKRGSITSLISKIAKGELDDRVFMGEIRGYTKELLQKIK